MKPGNLGPKQLRFLEIVRRYDDREDDRYQAWVFSYRPRGEHGRIATSLLARGLIEPNAPDRGTRDRQTYRLTVAGRLALSVAVVEAKR